MRTSTLSAIVGIALSCCKPCAIGFVMPSGRLPSVTSSGTASERHMVNQHPRRGSLRALAAEGKPAKGVGNEEEQGPMDLNLEQMFEVFEAADKEVSDEAVGKKSDSTKPGTGKDPAEAMGDMLSNFFGGGKK